MSAKQQLRPVAEVDAVEVEEISPFQEPAETTIFESIGGHAYPMRRLEHLSWQDRTRWTTLVNELTRVGNALHEYGQSALDDEDDWAEPLEPPAVLTQRFARVHKQICLFAFPTVPKEVWRKLDAAGTDEINRLAGRFLDVIQASAADSGGPEGNA